MWQSLNQQKLLPKMTETNDWSTRGVGCRECHTLTQMRATTTGARSKTAIPSVGKKHCEGKAACHHYMGEWD